MVAVQYRLGPFGWFAHPLVRESAKHPHDSAASFAVLDLIASLEWIEQNIALFGGDPQTVTIAGESHGAYNVIALLASPLARGLFHRAIVQSGGFDSMSIAEAEGDEGHRSNTSKKIVSTLGVENAAELRELTVEQLLSAHTPGAGFMDAPRIIEDGVVLPAHRIRESFASKSTFNAVPVILGTTLNEMKLFYVRDDRLIKMSLGLFPTVRDLEFWDLFTGYLSRLWRIRAVDEPARMMASAGHDDVYAYRFDWDDGGKLFLIDMHELFGASHGFDIPFVFNHFVHLGDADAVLFESDTTEEREKLSAAMGGFWASLAREGVPSQDGFPEWPSYSGIGNSFLRFDADSDGGIELVGNGGDSLEMLLDDMNTDPGLDADSRCFIVDEMTRWMYSMDIEDRIREATGCAG